MEGVQAQRLEIRKHSVLNSHRRLQNASRARARSHCFWYYIYIILLDYNQQEGLAFSFSASLQLSIRHSSEQSALHMQRSGAKSEKDALHDSTYWGEPGCRHQ